MNDSAEKNNERDFYNAVAEMRSVEDFIPVEADYRTSSFYIPENLDGIVIDSKMMNILSNGVIDEILENMKEKKLRVLDVCCGMGWLSLELARHGHCVEAYDLSNKSIDYAKEIRDLNSGADGFGVINYHNADVTKRNFEKDEFDVVIGWSAFHHIPNVEGFLDACKNSLKKGGVIITYDDFARGRKEIFFELLTRFLLPQIGYSYKLKFQYLLKYGNLKTKLCANNDSPMEVAASKSASVEIIDSYFYKNFRVNKYITKNAFCGTPLMRMPQFRLRHRVAILLNALDNLLIKVKLLKGFDRIIIAEKI